MKHKIVYAAVTAAIGLASGSAIAEQTRITVTIENLAPAQGTNQTPHWVGFHNGSFDIYNGGTPADSLPVPNDPLRSLERLAEDGNNGPISETFGQFIGSGAGSVDGTIAGPNGPIAPGDIATASFVVESTNPSSRFFSYASMVLPSNDFFYANANPEEHPMFDESGNFIAKDFIVTNQDIRDAGTEVNDEIPANTAFFGQEVADSGTEEGGNILLFGDESGLVRFLPPSEGGNILADENFSMADFTLDGYPLVKISFAAEPVPEEPEIQPEENFSPFLSRAALSGDQEVPVPVNTNASGRSVVIASNRGVRFVNTFRNLNDIQMAHFHLGAAGENGPVIANLINPDLDLTSPRVQRRLTRAITGLVRAEDLVGPLAGQPINVLADAIRAGNVYVNIHTTANPAGELRGQLEAREPRRPRR